MVKPMGVDHLVYATPDVDATVRELEARFGVRASPGGQHPGRGTRNALLALGPASYLEIVGPDAEQAAPPTSRWFRVDELTEPRLVTWAATAPDLERVRAQAALGGVPLGDIANGSRRRSDGVTLAWKFTSPLTVVADGVVPFLIDWGASPHPAANAATGLALVSLRAEHPTPDVVARMLALLEIELPVQYGAAPVLIAVIDGPLGRHELR